MNMMNIDTFDYSVFDRKKNICVDLGCGKGHFLSSYASRFPEKFIIGIDYNLTAVRAAEEKIINLKIENATSLTGEFVEFFEKIPENSLSDVFVICPDPWFKNRHRKRRTVTQDFIEKIASRLKPGGYFYLVHDFYPYIAEAAKFDFSKFSNPYHPHLFIHKKENFPYSLYMKKCLDSDGRIQFLIRQKI